MKNQTVPVVIKIVAVLILASLVYGVISIRTTGIRISDAFAGIFDFIRQGVSTFLQESRMLFR